jgi:hypothetical protein
VTTDTAPVRALLRPIGWLPFTLLCLSPAFGTDATLLPGAALPALEGTTLGGEPASLPRDAAGHDTLLVIGFSKAAAKVTAEWLTACRGVAAGGPPAPGAGVPAGPGATPGAAAPRLSCYDVRMLEEVPRPFRGMMERGMRSGFPAERQQQTILVYQDNEAWRGRLGASDPKLAYVVGIDAEGRVRDVARGAYTETEWKRILEWWSIR